MSIFDQILAKTAPEDRGIFDKYPELRASTEQLETALGNASRLNSEWTRWRDGYTDERGIHHEGNWDPTAGMTKTEKALADELAAARVQLQDGINRGAPAADLTDLRKEFDTKLGEVRTQSERQIEGMNYFYRAAASRLLPHQQEFKENLDPQKLMEFMQQNKISDPEIAYDKMVAGRRAELATHHQKEADEKHAADIAAAEQRGRDARSQEIAMGPGGFLPTDHTGGIAGITARIDKPTTVSDDIKQKIAEAKPGDGSLADLGYKLYREGAFSQVQ